jgi:hypothetical protein
LYVLMMIHTVLHRIFFGPGGKLQFLNACQSCPDFGCFGTNFWPGALMEKPLPSSFICPGGRFFCQVLGEIIFWPGVPLGQKGQWRTLHRITLQAIIVHTRQTWRKRRYHHLCTGWSEILCRVYMYTIHLFPLQGHLWWCCINSAVSIRAMLFHYITKSLKSRAFSMRVFWAAWVYNFFYRNEKNEHLIMKKYTILTYHLFLSGKSSESCLEN